MGKDNITPASLIKRKIIIKDKIADARYVKINVKKQKNKEKREEYGVYIIPASSEELKTALSKMGMIIEDPKTIKRVSKYSKCRKQIISQNGGTLAFNKKNKLFYKIVGDLYSE